VTGLGSLNQLHCTLPNHTALAGLDYVFFRLLEEGWWIAQRGLISLNLAMTREEVEGFGRAVLDAAKEVGKHLSEN
jgi:glutamate-1-semialdehyde 2,1-aminomutase